MQGCLLSTVQVLAGVSCFWDGYSVLHGNLVILVNFENLGLYTVGLMGYGLEVCFMWVLHCKFTLIVFLSSPCSAPTKEFCRSMEDLNKSFKNTCTGKSTPGRHFTTSPFPATATPSGHLKVPGSLISRCKSSSHLPQNPYGELQITRPSPSSSPKSFSEWDVASNTRKHIDGQQVMDTHIPTHTNIFIVLRN